MVGIRPILRPYQANVVVLLRTGEEYVKGAYGVGPGRCRNHKAGASRANRGRSSGRDGRGPWGTPRTRPMPPGRLRTPRPDRRARLPVDYRYNVLSFAPGACCRPLYVRLLASGTGAHPYSHHTSSSRSGRYTCVDISLNSFSAITLLLSASQLLKRPLLCMPSLNSF